MKTDPRLTQRAAILAALLVPCAFIHAQTAAAPAAAASSKEDDIIELSPFEVSADANESYNAATTLAGNRLNTNLRDVGSSVTVVTSQFLKDTGATNNASLLQRIGAEVGGVYGNFAGSGQGSSLSVLTEDTARPNENTRIRGLAAADNTRDFFRSDIPWDSYNVDRVDVQRGPNSILFGQGSPAGIINAGSKGASFRNSGEIESRVGSFGSLRESLDVNGVLVKNQVAFRLDALNNHEKYEQKPAYSKDKRVSGALRVEPEFLKQGGNRTIFKANFETGRIDSNNPRILPPVDHITPWFGSALNQLPIIAWNAWNNTGGTAAEAAFPAGYNVARPSKSPWFTNAGFGPLGDPFPLAAFTKGSAVGSTGTKYLVTDANQSIVPNIGGLLQAPGSWLALNGLSQWAVFSSLPYANGAAFKDASISDPSIFNFYKNLIDGDTKKEWQRFHSVTLNLTQTFLNDQVGFSLDFNREHVNYGQTNLFGGNVSLYVDPQKVYNDGTPNAGANGGNPYSDGTPNPGFGTPFVISRGGSNFANTSDRENKRATSFVTRDFRKDIPGWLGHAIGTQTLTGLISKDQQKTSTMNWNRFGYITDNNAYIPAKMNPATNTFVNTLPTQVIYLGDSLAGKSIAGANIPRITGNPTVGSGTANYFNDTWNNPNLSFAAAANVPWNNNAYLPSSGSYVSNQQNNPANYVGWAGQVPLAATDSEAGKGNREKLATRAALGKSVTTSQALVWQGKMLDEALVGMYGWRRDINKTWAASADLSNTPGDTHYKQLNFGALQLPTNPYGRIEVQSRTYSIVAHLNDLPGLKDVAKSLPFNVSLAYNTSSNFQPDSSRVNINGEAIAAPAGKTIDRGIMIETKDGKYSLKVNRYVTSLNNGTNVNSGAFSRALAHFTNQTQYWTNNFAYHINRGANEVGSNPATDRIDPNNLPLTTLTLPNLALPFVNPPGAPWEGSYFFTADNLRTQAMVDEETGAISGQRAYQNAVNAAIPNFWRTWGFTSLARMQSGTAGLAPDFIPNGFTLTENSVSKGWEIELNAQPTKNWRMTVNATRTDAVRSQIGDAALQTFMTLTGAANDGPAGNMHWYWGTADVPQTKQTLYFDYDNTGAPALGSFWAGLKSLQNSSVPELAKWRINMTTNYDITNGLLKNVNVGGGVRYQSPVIIGYPPSGDPLGSPAQFGSDLTRPVQGPNETYFDLWIGYHRKLTSKINWRIQLNAQNLFKRDSMIPVTLQGPFSGVSAPATYRIAPVQNFTLTNTLSF